MDKDNISKRLGDLGFKYKDSFKPRFRRDLSGDGIGISGRLTISSGDRVLGTTKNMVVDLGLEKIARIIGRSDQANNNLNFMSLGTNNSGTGPAEAATDTALVTEVFQKVFDTITFPNATSCEFVMAVPALDVTIDGVAIHEAGLKTLGGVLVARTTGSGVLPVTKQVGQVLEFRWTFTFQRI